MAEFLVTDFGQATDISINIIDELGFLVEFSPSSIHLEQNETETITAMFSVPVGTEVGLVSTVTVTATALLDQTFNTARSSLHVVAGEVDLEPPVCWLTLAPAAPCTETDPDECETASWMLAGGAQDAGAGLGELRALSPGQGNLTAQFSRGTKDPVEWEYRATCCNTNVSLMMVDILGNLQTGCGEEFELRNCSLHRVLEVGSSWIYSEWSRPCQVEPATAVDYNIVITNKETGDVLENVIEKHCNSHYCRSNFTYADPCTEYTINLNATFLGSDQVKTKQTSINAMPCCPGVASGAVQPPPGQDRGGGEQPGPGVHGQWGAENKHGAQLATAGTAG